MAKSDPAILKEVSVSLPFGIGSARWQTDSTERRATWSLYVELATRIAVQPLEANEGLAREALNSLLEVVWNDTGNFEGGGTRSRGIQTFSWRDCNYGTQ